MRFGVHGRAGVGVTDSGSGHIQIALMTSREIVAPGEVPQGRGCGVGRGLGVTLGVAVGGAVGVPVGEAVGVPVGEGEAGGVGVGVTPGQVPSTLYTICMFGKPISAVVTGSGIPQSAALR